MDRERWEGEGRVKREGAEAEREQGKGKEGSTWIFVQGPRVLIIVTPLAACSCCIGVGINQ